MHEMKTNEKFVRQISEICAQSLKNEEICAQILNKKKICVQI